MKIILIFLIVLLAGCATRPSMDELITEASQCVLEYNENGVIKPAPKEYKDGCWERVDRRIEVEDRRAARIKRNGGCLDRHAVVYCNNFGCRCTIASRRVFGRRPY